jgi:Uma2 family endonuclease
MVAFVSTPTEVSITEILDNVSLEDALITLPEQMEWVDGQFVEKTGMTLKTSRVQSRLDTAWRNFKDAQKLGGEVYTEPPCRTNQQIRRPDVAYLTPELLTQFGESSILPQSFPLIAEIVSPTDLAEEVFGKANEYLASGCQEVWVLLPDSHWMMILTPEQRSLFTTGETASSPRILPGFTIAIDQLFS